MSSIQFVEQKEIKRKPFQKIKRGFSIFFHLGKTPEARLLRKGDHHFEKKEYRPAIAEYSKAVAIDPFFAKAYLRRADAECKAGMFAKAILDYREACLHNPAYGGDLGLRLGLGEAKMGIDDIAFAKAYLRRADAECKAGMFAKAILDYREACLHNPAYGGDLGLRLGLGEAKMGIGDIAGALGEFSSAIELDNSCARAYLLRANAEYSLKRYSKSISDYDKARALNPEYDGDQRLHLNLGAARIGLGDIKGAIKEFDAALDIDPFYADAYVNRGKAFAVLNNNDEAIKNFKSALICGNYNDANIYSDRGKSHEYLEEFEQAEKDYTSAILLNRQNPMFFYNRAIVRRSLKNEIGAVEDLGKALEINPDFTEAKSLLNIIESGLKGGNTPKNRAGSEGAIKEKFELDQ